MPSKTSIQLQPRHSTLRTGEKVTLYPITTGPSSVPTALLNLLQKEFADEIERGCTYPFEEKWEEGEFAKYWFGYCGVVVLLDSDSGEGLSEGRDWEKECLGTFYIKPNYPGKYPLSIGYRESW